MGVARLLAKGWIVFCLFAGAHEFRFALMRGSSPVEALQSVGVPVLLFTAMGLLFIGGYGVSAAHGTPLIARFKPRQLIPGFNELVFIAFMIVSFVVQTLLAPGFMAGLDVRPTRRNARPSCARHAGFPPSGKQARVPGWH